MRLRERSASTKGLGEQRNQRTLVHVCRQIIGIMQMMMGKFSSKNSALYISGDIRGLYPKVCFLSSQLKIELPRTN